MSIKEKGRESRIAYKRFLSEWRKSMEKIIKRSNGVYSDEEIEDLTALPEENAEFSPLRLTRKFVEQEPWMPWVILLAAFMYWLFYKITRDTGLKQDREIVEEIVPNDRSKNISSTEDFEKLE